MIENYVHWNEDIGEWQLVSVPFTLEIIVELVLAAVGGGWPRMDQIRTQWTR